jgi:carboxyl-terminal processing protease
MTIAQFFRINGGTTQLRGVTPDIKLPTMGDSDTFGESSYDNALPWTQIKPAIYIPTGDMKEIVPLLDKKHEARVAKDKDFQYLAEDIALVKKQRKENSISLNEAARRKERDQQEARAKLREARLLSPRRAPTILSWCPIRKSAEQRHCAKPANGKARQPKSRRQGRAAQR